MVALPKILLFAGAIGVILSSGCQSKLDARIDGNTRSGGGNSKEVLAPGSETVMTRVFQDSQKDLIWTVTEGDQKGFGLALEPESYEPPLTVTASTVLNESDTVPFVLDLTVDKTLKSPMKVTLPDVLKNGKASATEYYVRWSAAPGAPAEILAVASHGGSLEFKADKSGRFEVQVLPELADFDMEEIPDFIGGNNFAVRWAYKDAAIQPAQETIFKFSLNASSDCLGVPIFEMEATASPAEVREAPEGAFFACLVADWHRIRQKKNGKPAKQIRIDRTPPVVSDLTIGLVTGESVNLTWTSKDQLSGLKYNRLYYAQSQPMSTVAEIQANGTLVAISDLQNQATISGLSLGRSYTFNVLAEDKAGHIGIGTPVTTSVIPNQLVNVSGSLEIASTASGSPSYMGTVNGKSFYSAYSPLGRELFITDGTQGGTFLVKDINPGPGDSSPSYPSILGSILLFTADNGATGQELWRSDGTAAGTWMVKELEPGAVGSNPQAPMPFGSFAVFSATTAAAGMELWRTDGTEAGTFMVVDLCPGTCSGAFYVSNYLSQANVLNGKLLFLGNNSTTGNELWSTDGTSAGTVLVKDINPGSSGSESVWYNMTQYNGSVYFAAVTAANGSELWRSDGTTGGTSLVKDILPGTGQAYPAYMVETGGKLVFRATDASNGTELWVSDGTLAGTSMLKDIYPGATSGYPDWVTVAGGIAYFKADDGTNGSELWRSDGTLAGTYMVADTNPTGASFIQGMYPYGNKMVFQNNALNKGQEFWITDGTGSGTFLLKDVNPDHRHSSAIAGHVVGGKMYFLAAHDFYGNELWVTDGTTAGTHLAVDFYGGSLATQKFVSNGSRATFIANDAATGIEPWIMEPGSIALLKDLNPGSDSSMPSNLALAGDKIYFDGYEPVNGLELWASDGTTAGTLLVKDATVGAGSSTILGLRALNNGVIYMSVDANGREPWVSDGTESGTAMLANIGTGAQHSNTWFNGIAFGPPTAQKFLMATGLTWSRPDLYITDGTTANTFRLKDIYDDDPVSTPSALGSKPTNFALAGSFVYFQARSIMAGTELHRTDGTEAGTIMIKDLNPGTASSMPERIVGAGNLVYFSADDGTGRKFWQTDGTAPGTVLVRSAAMETFSPPLSAVALNNVLYFSGSQSATGTELWRTDGTPAGTYIVKELVPGVQGGSPLEMQVFDGKIYFAASLDSGGMFDLWISDGTAPGTAMLPGFSGPVGHPPYILGSFGEVGNPAEPFELVVSCFIESKRVMRNFRSR